MQRSEPRIERSWSEIGFVVRISGSINEQLAPHELVSGLHGLVVFDLDGLTRVTSFGVREWLVALRELKADYYAFVRCRPAVVAQLNMVRGFAGSGEVVSFYAPYVCGRCGEDVEMLIDLRTDYRAVVTGTPPTVECPSCGGRAEFDDLPEQYFSYLASQPEPKVPLLAGRLIDGDAGRPLRVEKEVDGLVTALRLRGRLDERAKVKRILEGLEGYVLLELSGLTSANAEELERLAARADGDEVVQVQYARVPRDMARALVLFGRSGRSVRGVVSMLAEVRCRCGTPSSHEVVFDPGGAAAKPPEMCESCGAPLTWDVGEELIGALRVLGQPPAPEVRAFLSARPPAARRFDATPASGVRSRGEPSAGRRYEEVRRIGSGGMADVFLARQRGPEGFEKTVVLKRIRPSYVENPLFIGMFLQEARIAARISHPNVVQIFELGQDAHSFFIAMEYVEGWDLRAILRELRRRDRTMPVELACRIVADTCAGLHGAHTTTDEHGVLLGIVHRDVAPDNVLVSSDGLVKVADFGVAKALRSVVETRPGVVKGKLPYMAPEQIVRPNDDATPATDLWAVGVILYECLTGQPMFRGQGDYEMMDAIVHKPLPSIHDRGLPPRLEQIVSTALARDPTARYRTAQRLRRELESVLLERGVVTTAPEVASWVGELMTGRRKRSDSFTDVSPTRAHPEHGKTVVGPRDGGEGS